MISEKSVGRLSIIRRLLNNLKEQGQEYVYSHELASMTRMTAAQIRRDLMVTGYTGTPSKGYHIKGLIDGIRLVLDDPQGEKVALVGIGNLGRAILTYFRGRRPNLSIVAAFDVNPQKFDRVINGCRSYSVEKLEEVVELEGISVGIIAVPAPIAQKVADCLVDAGIKGILNFAPVPLIVPSDIFVEDFDMTMALEKVAYFARPNNK